jgi:hypothetical protein
VDSNRAAFGATITPAYISTVRAHGTAHATALEATHGTTHRLSHDEAYENYTTNTASHTSAHSETHCPHADAHTAHCESNCGNAQPNAHSNAYSHVGTDSIQPHCPAILSSSVCVSDSSAYNKTPHQCAHSDADGFTDLHKRHPPL